MVCIKMSVAYLKSENMCFESKNMLHLLARGNERHILYFLQRRRSKFCIIFHTKHSMLTFAFIKCVFCKQDEGMKEERENDMCKCSYIKKVHYNIAE